MPWSPCTSSLQLKGQAPLWPLLCRSVRNHMHLWSWSDFYVRPHSLLVLGINLAWSI